MANSNDDTGAKPKVGNTLDYYNDEMPRKAVGRLFDDLDLDDEQEDMVVNYEKEKDREKEPGRESEPAPAPRPRSSKRLLDDYDISLYQRNNIQEDEMEELMVKPKAKRSKMASRAASNPNAPSEGIFSRWSEPAATANIDDDTTSAPIKMFISVAFLILILILVMLVVRVNANNRIIDEYKLQVAQIDSLRQNYDLMSDENERLTKELKELQAAKDAPGGSGSSGTLDDPEQSDSSTSSGESPTQSQSYTVASGDNLSKISKRFYGTPNDYKKIMEANSLTSEVVKVGQVLIIP